MKEQSQHEPNVFLYVNACFWLLLLIGAVGGVLWWFHFRSALMARAAADRQLAEAQVREMRQAEEVERQRLQKELAGEWVLIAGRLRGQPMSKQETRGGRLTIHDNQQTITINGLTRRGIFILRPTRTPAGIDLQETDGPRRGETFLGIYECDGASFAMSFAEPGASRPRNLDEGTCFYRWKRPQP
jgi:uncharacterized protein (TIGR03067 family)